MSGPTLRKFLVFLGVVAVCFFVLDRTLALGLQAILKQSEFRFSRLYKGGLDSDIVILGNSRSVNAFFAPEMEKRLGKKVIHLGYNGMSMEIAEAAFLDYIEHNNKPDMLLLEVTNLHVSNELLKDFKLFTGFSPRLRALLEREYPALGAACEISHLYRFNNEFFMRCLYYLKGSDQAWINSGQMSRRAAEVAAQSDFGTANLYPTEGRDWASLLALIEFCNKEEIQLKLITSPYYPPYLENYEDYEEDRAAFLAVLPEPGLFVDYGRLTATVGDFADPIHINKSGSLKLFDALIRDGIFNETGQ